MDNNTILAASSFGLYIRELKIKEKIGQRELALKVGIAPFAVTLFGIIKYNQLPNIYGSLGIILIIIGVILVNYLEKVSS